MVKMEVPKKELYIECKSMDLMTMLFSWRY